MDVKEKSKKRELIKSVAIVFLAVLLLLTFFSGTIMNASLPEVATQRASSGTINARIRGSGTVAAAESYEVVIDQTREVRTVCVKVGDSVERGDVLFILEDVDSTELQSAQDELQELNTSYQRQLLTLAQEYTGEDRTIRDLQAQLEKLNQQRDENLVTDGEIATAQTEVDTAEDDLSWLQFDLKQMEAELDGAQKALTAAQSELDYWDGRISSLEGNSDADADAAAAKRVLESYWLAYEGLYREFLLSVMAYYENDPLNETYHIFGEDDMLRGIYYVFKLSPETKTDQEGNEIPVAPTDRFINIEDGNGLFTITSDQQKYIDAYLNAMDLGSSAANPPSTDTGTPEPEPSDGDPQEPAEGGEENDPPASQPGKITGREQYTTLLNAYNTWQSAQSSSGSGTLAYARSQRNNAQAAVVNAESNVSSYESEIATINANIDKQGKLIEDLKASVEDLKAKQDTYNQAVEDIATTQQSLADALEDQNLGHQLDDLDLATMRRQVERKQEEVDKLRSDVIDTEIKANVSGTITAINVTAGHETTAGSPMAVINVSDRGYTMRISVTSEQARQVKVGDTAEVTNYYWGSNIEAVVTQIVADPESSGQRRLLVFQITGDVDPGTNLTLSIGQRSETYNAIVPKSALREDSNGQFVLMVTSRSTPLGNRYTATRVDVQVLAEDDTSAAVSGLAANDYVITTSSAPLNAGSQVRLVEDPS